MIDNPQPSNDARDRMVDEIVEQTGIDEAMIDRLVQAFYAAARQDPLLGPVFDSKVDDWEAHFARMRDFWSSIALMSGRYHGQPMAKHVPLPVDTPHFDRWLEIFAATAQRVCPLPAAAYFLDRAHRIADSLELGIAFHKKEIRPKRARPPETFLAGVAADHPAAVLPAAHAPRC